MKKKLDLATTLGFVVALVSLVASIVL